MSFENETFEVGEPDVTEGKSNARSAFNVLKSLSENPFEQARKLTQYLASANERKAKLVKSCSPQALELVAKHHPGLLR